MDLLELVRRKDKLKFCSTCLHSQTESVIGYHNLVSKTSELVTQRLVTVSLEVHSVD